MSLDFDPEVYGFPSQYFRIVWALPLPQHSHVPDFFIRHTDGSAVVLDVRLGCEAWRTHHWVPGRSTRPTINVNWHIFHVTSAAN